MRTISAKGFINGDHRGQALLLYNDPGRESAETNLPGILKWPVIYIEVAVYAYRFLLDLAFFFLEI